MHWVTVQSEVRGKSKIPNTPASARGTVADSDGCATAAGPRDLRLKHDGRSLPAPFLPVKVGSVDFPIEKGGNYVFLLIFQVRFVSVKSIEIRCKIGKRCSEGERSKQDKLKSDQERRKSEPRAAS
jgi:hypothetical protein